MGNHRNVAGTSPGNRCGDHRQLYGSAGICLLPPGASQQPRAKGGVKLRRQKLS